MDVGASTGSAGAAASTSTPRYLYTNKSTDIQEIFLEACGWLGVDARRNNTWSISVARREVVSDGCGRWDSNPH